MNPFYSGWEGPARVVEVELTTVNTWSKISHRNPATGIVYERAVIVVRLAGFPIGTVEVRFVDCHDLEVSGCLTSIVSELGEEILSRAHKLGYEITDSNAADLIARLQTPEAIPLTGDPIHQPPASLPLVSVIIATRNRAEKLRLTLEHVLKLDYPSYEIIVVDNAPADDSTQNLVMSSFDDPRLKYVRELKPGLSNARNRGIAQSKGQIIAITDDDVLVDSAWLSNLVANFEENDGEYPVVCVTGLILPAELETPAQELLEKFGGFNKGYERVVYDAGPHRVQSVLYPYSAGLFGSGANIALTRKFLCEINGFDPALGAGTMARGGEDLALLFQVIASRSRLVYEPRAIVYHFHHREIDQLRNTMYCYGVGLVAYILKVVFDRPWRLLGVLIRVPAGLVRLFDPNSEKNVGKGLHYPAELTRLERLGMLHGPLLFVFSLVKSRKLLGRRYPDLNADEI